MESQEKLHSETQNEVKNSEQTPESIVEIKEETAETVEEVVSNDVTPAIEEEAIADTDEEVAPTAEEEIVEAKPEETPVVEEAAQVEETATTVEEPEIAPETETIAEDVLPEVISIDEDLILDEEIEDVEPHADVDEDYSTYSEFELVGELRNLLAEPNFLAIMPKVDSIKINFYKKQKAKIQEEKKKFIEEGGFEEDFVAEENPYEVELKNLLAEYRHKKLLFNKDIEADKEKNLAIKYEIIEEIKSLVNRKESINKTFQEFKELQAKWREVGLVPQANMKDLWENYHHHVENFYDYIKINKELRDLDLKKNLEEKILLCEKAEALIIEPSVIKAFNTLQKLHDSWREIGPVPRDKKEEVWERFKDATTQINKKHQDFFENRKKSQKKNLDAKTALCEKVEEILTENLSTHKDWEDKSKELVELQKYWRTIGFAPKKENDEIYDRFRKACDGFFDLKRDFYSKHKDVQTNNLQMKMDLCVQAESLKESTDWKKTTDELIAIQKRWKEIGPVPRKNSDILWKRFRAACDEFFNKKATFFNSKDEVQNENLRLKNELIEEVVNFKSEGKDQDDFERLRELQRRWMEIGHVPISVKDDIQKRFREAINKQFEKLRVDDKDRSLMRFKSKMSDLKTSNRGHNKMFAERDKHAAKLKQLESDLITLKNNIGFFSNSKNAEALIKDVQQKIKNTEEQIIYLKDKIRVIDDVDYSEA
jgi:hypothetical protein